jgi:hypothetical protein
MEEIARELRLKEFEWDDHSLLPLAQMRTPHFFVGNF